MDNKEGFTRKLARFIVNTDADMIPQWAFDHARTAFMDWIAVTLGGTDDPLVNKLITYADMMGGNLQATIIGRHRKTDVSHAALINGSASHVLDYDDTLVSFLGHPSVTLFPALLALSELHGSSGHAFLSAYLIGLQAGGTIGACAGLDHYMAGWHATSTLGHLASAAACSRLMSLDEQQTIHALGIAGTQSSGLKRVFGTMCKPFHAGRSSQAGLIAALLAREGFTSAEDILEGPQGFFHVLKGAVNDDVVSLLGLGWDVQNLSQKYHASCHATHSPMEAAMELASRHAIAPERISRIIVHSSQMALDAAGKERPRTGMEGKFSISYCVANALLMGETGTKAFTDEKVNASEIQEFMKKIAVEFDPEMKALESRVEIETLQGETYSGFSDILQNIPSFDIKQERVRSKFMDLCEPGLGMAATLSLEDAIGHLVEIKDMKQITQML
ncbi:MAG: MmgE/PrpD family protein [Deltaproteobacteria bacterium]|nr:MmgE/PrpD family protein [Deltaproteobacteria bacterium]